MTENNIIDTNQTSVFDVSEKDFIEKVIEGSENHLVVVDFWAPWCGPCKQLGPTLEKVINGSNGKAVLAKINIDDNQQIAAQLRIQSIPTVMAFKNKKIANAFQGVIPEKKIIEFIEEALGEKIEKDNSEFYEKINQLNKENKFDESEELLEEFIGENSNDEKGIKLYLDTLIHLKKYEEVKSFISSLSDDLQKSDSIKSTLTNLEIKEKEGSGPSIEELKINLKKDPKNIDALIDLSEKYFVGSMYDESFDLLLKSYSNNNSKDKEKIKKIILKYFDALGVENDITKTYRRKFSTVMFS